MNVDQGNIMPVMGFTVSSNIDYIGTAQAVPLAARPPCDPSIHTPHWRLIAKEFCCFAFAQIRSSSPTCNGARFLYSKSLKRSPNFDKWLDIKLSIKTTVSGPWTRISWWPSVLRAYTGSRWIKCELNVKAENRNSRALVGVILKLISGFAGAFGSKGYVLVLFLLK